MQFDLAKTIEILSRTPAVLNSLLGNLSIDWTQNNEGGETWSPYDVVGHLVHNERTNWLVKTKMILSEEDDKRFKVQDRMAQFKESEGKTMADLLDEFARLRANNVQELKSLNISKDTLDRTGIHSAFGEVTLCQLLGTWTVHDLAHINQIARVMAKQYKSEVGPWIEYLSILK